MRTETSRKVAETAMKHCHPETKKPASAGFGNRFPLVHREASSACSPSSSKILLLSVSLCTGDDLRVCLPLVNVPS